MHSVPHTHTQAHTIHGQVIIVVSQVACSVFSSDLSPEYCWGDISRNMSACYFYPPSFKSAIPEV